MRKKLAILIITILSLGTILVGCKRESPTDVVNIYFEQLKKGDTEQANEFIESTISQTEEETSDASDNVEEETDEVMEEALKLYLSKIDAKVLSEEIDGDNASVEVEINGPNFSNMMMEVIQESLADAFSGKEMDEDYMSRSFLEKVKSSKNEVRTGKVNLTKEDKNWKIKSDDNIVNLMLGKASNQDSSLSK
ncbi:hypothetical protein [Terrisporobacter sp.]|uniref:hypothetical protein n=1 Tax=Terrisporobacter sp. TaxID=1965305 RepID=UPI00261A9BC7|nr:hypothetical protein [Terrisporobacter sp.]